MTKPRNTIITGDALTVVKTLPDEFVQCCVCSPPYWGLRDYGTATWEGGDSSCNHSAAKRKSRYDYSLAKSPIQNGSRKGTDAPRYHNICPCCGARRIDQQLGLERTIDEYVAKLVEIFSEVRRVMRADGCFFLNIGDSYTNGNRLERDHSLVSRTSGLVNRSAGMNRPKTPSGLKPKDLCMIPARVALALQADGWWLRSDIIWAKPNPMPESVTDRPTRAHEYVFLLTKQARYFYDADAIKEQQSTPIDTKANQTFGAPGGKAEQVYGHKVSGDNWKPSGFRNARSVWTITTEPFPEAHFATYPKKLVERCILAGTSEKGNCAKCGKPWIRVVQKSRSFESGSGKSGNAIAGKQDPVHGGGETKDIRRGPCVSVSTTGWRPQCECGAPTVPSLVLDPFIGSGTTAVVAKMLRRSWIGIELNPEYVKIAEKRLSDGPLFQEKP